MILYKCHLFGVNPPALTSTIGASSINNHLLHTPLGGHQYSTVAWRLHDLFNYDQAIISNGRKKRHVITNSNNNNNNNNGALLAHPLAPLGSDCSLCLNIDRKYQCAWCNSQCQHSNQCSELAAPACPAPRIDSVSIIIMLFVLRKLSNEELLFLSICLSLLLFLM